VAGGKRKIKTLAFSALVGAFEGMASVS